MNNDNIGIGDAPCGGCGIRVYQIRLLLDTQEDDGAGGYWWQAEPGQKCPHCGEPFAWYHKPTTPEDGDVQR